ncbi:MAG TPA: hypothetical protein ENI60_06530 [Candidatus Fraserbacteria bacterium]|nr:hypothetical protein [Candidatus Fraserbacteria bacterium]
MANIARQLADEGESHRQLQELLPWYLNGTLEPDEREKTRAHLEYCAVCRRELAELEGLQQALVVAPDEAPQLDESLLDETLRRVGAQSQATDPKPAARLRRGWGWLKPRRAFSYSLGAILLLGLGTFLGFTLATNRSAVGLPPLPWERTQETTHQFFAFPRDILLQGTLTTEIGSRAMAQETFTLEKLHEGDLLLTSKIESDKLAGAGEAVQRLKLDANLRPLSYTIQGPLVYGGQQAGVTINGDSAELTLTSARKVTHRIVPLLGQPPVLLDFSVMSHFVLLERLATRLWAKATDKNETLHFSALIPQALRADTLTLKRSNNPTVLRVGPEGKVLSVSRYLAQLGQGKDALHVELFVRKSDGTLLALRIPVQPQLPSTEPVFVFRSDLFPQGLSLADNSQGAK